MIIKDLIPDVDFKYNTLAGRKGRAIGGLSMGGYGALAIGLKNSDIFNFVFSTAGAINFCKNVKSEMARDTTDWNSPQLWSDGDKTVDVKNFSTQFQRTPRGLVFKTASDADANDPYNLLSKLDSVLIPFIQISCGTGDQFLNESFDFVQKVREKTKNYCFTVLPGEHENPYWEHSIKHTFMIMQDIQFFSDKTN
jgi:putative tributyrin esterase